MCNGFVFSLFLATRQAGPFLGNELCHKMNYSSAFEQWQGSFEQAQAACAFSFLCKNRYFQGTLALKATPEETMNHFNCKLSYTETRV